MLLLAIDTCGPMGSVALGRLAGGEGVSPAIRDIEILGEIELEGRSYSSTLVMAVGNLLKNAGVGLKGYGQERLWRCMGRGALRACAWG